MFASPETEQTSHFVNTQNTPSFKKEKKKALKQFLLTFSVKRNTDKHKVISSGIITTCCSNSDRSAIKLKSEVFQICTR